MCQWYALELGKFWVLCIISFMVRLASAVLLQLYLSVVRPHVEYAAAIWSPHLKKDIILIEKFALRMVFGAWGGNYDHLLSIANLPTLENSCDVAYYIKFWMAHGISNLVYTPSWNISL